MPCVARSRASSTWHGKATIAIAGTRASGRPEPDSPIPRHLAGRAFGVVVHGDAAGTEVLRRALMDWLCDMELVPAGNAGTLDRYIGYFEPYATSHAALDRDEAVQEEVRNVARSLLNAVVAMRDGRFTRPDASLQEPRPK